MSLMGHFCLSYSDFFSFAKEMGVQWNNHFFFFNFMKGFFYSFCYLICLFTKGKLLSWKPMECF